MTNPPPTASAADTNESTLEPAVSGPDTTVEQRSELEPLPLSAPTLPGDPREQEIQEQRRRRARLGEHWRGAALTVAGVAAAVVAVLILATG